MADQTHPTLSLSDLQKDSFDRQKRIPGWDQEALKQGNVLLVGAGALGNEVCKNLAQCGIGTITVVDPDVVEHTNLNRCVYFLAADVGCLKATTLAERIRSAFPETSITGVPHKFEDTEEQLIEDVNLVISCVDSIDVRLTINRSCTYHLKPLIDGGTTGLYGRAQTIVPPDSACLDCRWRHLGQKQMLQRYRCGEEITWFDRPEPAVSTTTSAVAAVQAMEVVKVLKKLHASDDNTQISDPFEILVDKIWTIDLNTNITKVLGAPRDASCPYHNY